MDPICILNDYSQKRLRSIQVLCDSILAKFSIDEIDNYELLSELNSISVCIETLREKNYVNY